MTDWQCQMCGKTAKEKYNQLLADAKKLKGDPEKKAEAIQNARQWLWERNSKDKVTCSKACGWNYSSWKKGGFKEPKDSYTSDSFYCQCCAKWSEGGRVVKNPKDPKDELLWLKVCRKCHRKQLTNLLRKRWEKRHCTERKEYKKAWLCENKEKFKKYRDDYRKRKGENVGLYRMRRHGKAWSLKFDKCRHCGTTSIKHRAKGYCRRCYWYSKQNKPFPREFRVRTPKPVVVRVEVKEEEPMVVYMPPLFLKQDKSESTALKV